MSLSENVAPLLAFAAMLHEDASVASVAYETVRADVDNILRTIDDANAPFPPAYVDDAMFAVYAYVDEALLTSQWEGRRQWAQATLQRTRAGTINAGVEFYGRCERLLQSMPLPTASAQHTRQNDGQLTLRPQSALPPPLTVISTSLDAAETSTPGQQTMVQDVLNIYATCLALGFRGRLYSDADRQTLYRTALDSLGYAMAGRINLDEQRLTPEAYYMPESPKANAWAHWRQMALFITIPACITALLFFAYSKILTTYSIEWIRNLQ